MKLYDDGTRSQVFLPAVSLADLEMSRVNPRQTYDEGRVKALSKQISTAGYDSTRAVKVHRDPDGTLRVFAGSTRAMAAEMAGLKSIPAYEFVGYTDDELWGLAYEDNDGDDKHTSLPLVDMWADYAARAAIGYTAQDIASVMKIDEALAERRIRWATSVKGKLREYVAARRIDETILGDIDGINVPPELTAWATTEQLRDEAASEICGGLTVKTGPELTRKQARGVVAKYRELIGEAQKAVAEHAQVALTIASHGVRNLVGLRKAQLIAQREVEQQQQTRYEGSPLGSPTEPVMSSKKKALDRFEALSNKIEMADARTLVVPKTATLVLTDPPYGMAFQSNTRVVTPKKDEIASDGTIEEAVSLLGATMSNLYPQLADDATALVFTGWRFENELRNTLVIAGFTIVGSLIWVRPNTGMGDVYGTFAPKHDRIIHAIKGNPKLNGRPPDVLEGGEVLKSGHPTEKPVDLLRLLIETTTLPGDCVVEPFAGSGSTIMAALDTGRDFRAREIDQQYFDRIQDMLLRRAEQG